MISFSTSFNISGFVTSKNLQRLPLLPVCRLLEGMGGTVDGLFPVMPPDQHQAHGQAVHLAAGDGDGGMAGGVKLAGVQRVAEGGLHDLVVACVIQ